MALINCPECKKEISDTAPSCPNCGYIMKSNSEKKHSIKKKTTTRKTGCGTIIFALLIVISLTILLSTLSNDEDNSENQNDSVDHSELLAYTYAEDFVKKRLKAPATAEFPKTREKINHTTNYGEGKYKIRSWVDSQNGFGALIRSSFNCTIEFEGTTVRCTSLQIDN